jgi:hypothetical protein
MRRLSKKESREGNNYGKGGEKRTATTDLLEGVAQVLLLFPRECEIDAFLLILQFQRMRDSHDECVRETRHLQQSGKYAAR